MIRSKKRPAGFFLFICAEDGEERQFYSVHGSHGHVFRLLKPLITIQAEICPPYHFMLQVGYIAEVGENRLVVAWV